MDPKTIQQETTREENGWDKCWKQGMTPWDKCESAPILVDLLTRSTINFPQNGRSLVPGCGSGCDVYLLGSRGFESFGIDVSETAIKRANDASYADRTSPDVIFICGSFFDYEFAASFDVIYDYTLDLNLQSSNASFFCAIDPSLRESWGQRMGDLIVSDGLLITLMYPIGDHIDGPPYAVQPQQYVDYPPLLYKLS